MNIVLSKNTDCGWLGKLVIADLTLMLGSVAVKEVAAKNHLLVIFSQENQCGNILHLRIPNMTSLDISNIYIFSPMGKWPDIMSPYIYDIDETEK